jgi:quinoprotein glucose dehydrogenase
MFLPGVVSKVEGPIAALTLGTAGGGTNWPGAGADPERHIVYAQAANAGITPIGLVPPPPGFSDLNYVAGTAGQPFQERLGPGFGSAADSPLQGRGNTPPPQPAAGRGGRGPQAQGGGGGGLTVQGLPLLKPPYGVLNAIDLDKGEIKWQVPHGDTPDAVRNSPALKGLNIPKTGQQGSVGLLVTKTLVVLGDPQVTTTPEHPRGAMLRAYNKDTGAEVGAVWMPAPQSGSPMTYKGPDGRQYIVVAVSGGAYSGEYISFALPSAGERPTSQR